MAFTLISFIAFTALVAIISWWKTRDDDLSTKDGYFLAGRGLTGIVIAGSLMMTNLSAEQLVGLNGQSFSSNMSVMQWEVTASFSLTIFAFLFIPRFMKSGITTVPEFFEKHYDTTTKRLFSLMFLIAYIVTMLPVILYSGAVVLEQIFDISGMFGLSEFGGIVVVCVATGVVGAIYAIFGGLKAVAISDTVNGVGLLVGGFVVPIFGLIALGSLDGGGLVQGIQHFLTATPEKMNAWAAPNALPPEVPWPLMFTGMLVNNLFYYAANQSMIQRVFAAKNLAEGQKGAIWSGFFKILDAGMLVIPGIIAFQLFGDSIARQGGTVTDAAYPLLLLSVVPKPLLGFLAAVMFGAILSSFNSVLNSAVTIFTLDLYHPICEPQASAPRLVHIGKVFGTIVAVISIAISPFIMSFGAGITTFINECWGFFSMPLLVAVIFGLFSQYVPAIAPKIVIPLHMVLYALSKVCPFTQGIHYLYVVFTLFIFECIIFGLCTKFAPRATACETAAVADVDLTPWKHRKVFAIAILCITVGMYLVFSPLVLARV